eukprot:352240-Chlamydomonas_euryale.AAC.2
MMWNALVRQQPRETKARATAIAGLPGGHLKRRSRYSVWPAPCGSHLPAWFTPARALLQK